MKTRSQHLLRRALSGSIMGSVLICAVLLGIMLAIKPAYLAYTNVIAIVKVLTITALVGLSQMISIASGGMNVAVGSIGALSAVIAGGAMDRLGVAAPIAAVMGLTTGALCGLVNGLLIHRAGGVGIAFFLTTLATSSIFQGINLTITSGNPFYGIRPEFFAYGDTLILGVPLSFYIMLTVAAILAFLFARVSIGRQILAYGANPRAATLYGVSGFKVVVLSNLIAGTVASVAGLLAMIRIQAAQPNMGADWMLQSFASTLIGGTLLSGGRVSAPGTILGALALTIVTNGLVHLRVNTYWNSLIYGLIILISVGIDRLRCLKGGVSGDR